MAERFSLLGAPVDRVSMEEAVRLVRAALLSRTRIAHVSINAAKIVQIQTDEQLRSSLWDFELSTADGQAVVWAARVLGQPLPERVAGIDLMHRLLCLADCLGGRVYLLGAAPSVVARAAARIRETHPSLDIVGARDGFYDDEAAVLEDVARSAPDMLFLALPSPQKELLAAHVRTALRIPFVMGVGGAFDVLAGDRHRAPRWVQLAGLEWLARLLQEPRRLAGRYLLGNSHFLALVAHEALRSRLQRNTT